MSDASSIINFSEGGGGGEVANLTDAEYLAAVLGSQHMGLKVSHRRFRYRTFDISNPNFL